MATINTPGTPRVLFHHDQFNDTMGIGIILNTAQMVRLTLPMEVFERKPSLNLEREVLEAIHTDVCRQLAIFALKE